MTARVDIERLRARTERADRAHYAHEREIARLDIEGMLPAILAELERGRRIEEAAHYMIDVLGGEHGQLMRKAITQLRAALAQPDEKESKDGR